MSYAPDTRVEVRDPQPSQLPPEILLQIVFYIPFQPNPQPTLHAFCLVSRSWYAAGIGQLYHSPHIASPNFLAFVAAVCPSINAHVRRSALAHMVRRLDLSRLVHDSSHSLTARLLGRTKSRLEEFVAPQSSFAFNSLAALSKCANLHTLDLSLVWSRFDSTAVFRTLSKLPRLHTLRFPRSAMYTSTHEPARWPPALTTLHLSGHMPAAQLLPPASSPAGPASTPPALGALTVSHCPTLTSAMLLALIASQSRTLTRLDLVYPLAHLPVRDTGLDHTLAHAPRLRTLRIPSEYITNRFFPAPEDAATPAAGASPPTPASAPTPTGCPPLPPHPLHSLTITRDTGAYDADTSWRRLDPDALFLAVAEHGLAGLRRVRVARELGWTADAGAEELQELLEALGREEDGGAQVRVKGGGAEMGVWAF